MSRKPRKPTPQEREAGLFRTLRTVRAALRREMRRRRTAEDDLKRATDPMLNDLRIKDGQIDMTLAGKAVERIAAIFAATLIGAPNYNELKMEGRSKVTGEDLAFTVTVQKLDGKTPHELRRKAEASLDKLLDALTTYAKAQQKHAQESTSANWTSEAKTFGKLITALEAERPDWNT